MQSFRKEALGISVQYKYILLNHMYYTLELVMKAGAQIH